MKSLDFGRYTLCSCVAAAILAGCGGSQPPISAPGAMPQNSAIATHAEHGKSWMLPEAKNEDLIYAVGGCGGTCVLSYPKGKLVGELTGVDGGADCSDSNGDVFVSEQTDVVEFAHGGTTPIATYDTPYTPPSGCSVDPESGSLAVVNQGSVAVFPAGSQNPTSYNTLLNAQYCGYDNAGNLFVNGFDAPNFGLSELPKGGSTFEKLRLDQSVGQPGQIQWDGQYVSYESQESGQPTISRLSISDSTATVVGQTRLKRVPRALRLSWIYQGSVVAPYVVSGPASKDIGIWKYPKGASTKRIMQFGDFNKKPFIFSGVTVSVGPSR
jgi:hypothetical protein